MEVGSKEDDFFLQSEDLSSKKSIREIYNKQTVVLFAIRRLGWSGCQRVVADYAAIGDRINALKARQLLISFEDGTGLISLAEFREYTGYKGEIWVDTERHVYKKFHCNSSGSSFLKSLGTSMFGKASKFLSTANLEGDYDQQGGEFVLDPEEVVIYAHVDKNAGEFTDFDGILKVLAEQLGKTESKK